MPPGMKFKGGDSKYILKKSITHLIPGQILNRKDKMGFPVPLTEWMMEGSVKQFVADVLLSKKVLKEIFFKRKALEDLVKNPGVGARKLWGALCLELWHTEFIDGKK